MKYAFLLVCCLLAATVIAADAIPANLENVRVQPEKIVLRHVRQPHSILVLGKTKDGYFIAVRFLSDPPAIDVEHNYSADDGLTSTWCLYEAAEPITEAEYREAFEKAIEHPEVVFH